LSNSYLFEEISIGLIILLGTPYLLFGHEKKIGFLKLKGLYFDMNP
jgi:hypothetical protein